MSEKKPFELKKMWQWLVYLYVVLPALLFLLGFLTRNMDMGILFARLCCCVRLCCIIRLCQSFLFHYKLCLFSSNRQS